MISPQMTPPELMPVTMTLQNLDAIIIGLSRVHGQGNPLSRNGIFILTTGHTDVPFRALSGASHFTHHVRCGESALLDTDKAMVPLTAGRICGDFVHDKILRFASQRPPRPSKCSVMRGSVPSRAGTHRGGSSRRSLFGDRWACLSTGFRRGDRRAPLPASVGLCSSRLIVKDSLRREPQLNRGP